MHTTFDQLIATLKATKEEQSTGTQLLYLMKAYKTNPDNEEWMAHVRNMDSMINSDQIKDVQALQGNAKCYYTTLVVNEGKWKKQRAVQNQSAFSGQSNSQNANANAKGKEWKFNKSLGHNNKLSFNGSEYKWCNGPCDSLDAKDVHCIRMCVGE